MMNSESRTTAQLIEYMAEMSGKSKGSISNSLGKARNYINCYISKKRTPNISLFVKIAKACGYEVHIIGHDEDITLDLE